MTSISGPLGRMARVLDLVAASPNGATTVEIAASADLPIATAHRIVAALLAEGYLERSGRGHPCRIGSRLRRLGTIGHLAGASADAVRPMLQSLADTVDAVAYLMRRDGAHVDTAAQALPSRTQSTIVLPGVDIPLHATSSGKVLMAWLDAKERRKLLCEPLIRYRPATITNPDVLESHLRAVRRRGYATCRDEFDRGVFSISIPVRPDGRTVSLALGIVGFDHSLLSSWPEHSLKALLTRVGRQIEGALSAEVAC